MSNKFGLSERASQTRWASLWRIPARVVTCMLAVLLPLVAGAHHSFAMYDQTRLLTIKGTVVEWNWANPHISLTIVVPTGASETRWVLAGQSVSTWARVGMHGKDVNVGDKVSLQFNPAKDGSNNGYIRNIVLPNGQTFGDGPVTVPAPNDKPVRDDLANPLEAPR